MKNLNVGRTLTFRQIFITLCILMVANMCITLFMGASQPVKKPAKLITTLHECVDPTHEKCDGLCSCDGLGCLVSMSNTGYIDAQNPSGNYKKDYEPDAEMYDDEMRENMRDFQLDMQHNGDIIIYSNQDSGPEYVGTYKAGSKCDILHMLRKYDNDND